jgi:mycobactin peptide synthetase MbtE
MVAILLSGGYYCPLSSDQPTARLDSLIEQVQAKCVLVHSRTKTLVSTNSFDIERILSLSNWTNGSRDIRLDTSSIAYVIFTSGSTGTPKVVPISHKKFAVCIDALTSSSIMCHNDAVIQTTPPTFDIHIQEILGSLWLGGSLCLLRPHGNLDMTYVASVIQRHQISFAVTVPTLLATLAQHVHSSPDQHQALFSLRRLCSIGNILRFDRTSIY